jgi:hypothetical protein
MFAGPRPARATSGARQAKALRGFTKFLDTFKIDRCPDCARTNQHVHCVHQHGGVKANDIHPDMVTRRDRLREQLWRRRELYEDAAPSRA